MGLDLPAVSAASFVAMDQPLPPGAPFVFLRLEENPNVLLVDFVHAARMSDTLDRISNFVEMRGRRRVSTDAEIEQVRNTYGAYCIVTNEECGFTDGHDLKLADVAAFYQKCSAQGIVLSGGEQQLLNRLTALGLITVSDYGIYEAQSDVVLVAMSRSLDPATRRPTFVHEYSHALYFTDPTYRQAVAKAWKALQPEVRQFVNGILRASVYHSGEPSLIETEAAAYTLAGPMTLHGLALPLHHAANYCIKHIVESLHPESPCSAVLGFQGDLLGLLHYLHGRFAEISRGRVPLLQEDEALGSDGVAVTRLQDLQAFFDIPADSAEE